MQPTQISRRQMLTLAGLTLGVGIVDLTGATDPAYAAPTEAPTLEPIANTPVGLLHGDGTAPSVAPRQLAVRVVHTGDLPAGTRIAITFDPRRYVPLTPAVIMLNGVPVTADTEIISDSKTGQRTSTITLTEAVAAANGELIAVVGTAHPLLYPHDLARHSPTPTARIRRAQHKRESQRSLQPTRPSSFGGSAQPWGMELATVWGGESWGDEDKYHYPVPVRITLRSVGPGPAPKPMGFAVSVDPRLVSAIEVSRAQLNYRRFNKRVSRDGTVRTGSVLRNQWHAPVQLVAGDVLDVYLKITTVVPDHQLTGVKHPVVAVMASGATTVQRLTGLETLTRNDAVCADTADG